jgi:hypothetical protein
VNDIRRATNPTQVPNQTISSGTWNFSDNNGLAASNVVISGSASVTFVAGNCIHLQPGFHATAGTAGTTFHAWVETAPTADSVSPSSGTGLGQAFTWKASSPSGYTNLSEMQALFNTSVSGQNACYIRYNRAANLLYLADNAGSAWLGGLVPGTSGTAANSQCSIDASGSSASGSGNQLTLMVSVTFQTSFSGAKNDYLIANDQYGLNSGWQQMGTWTVPSGNQPPQAVSVNPSSGSGLGPQQFQFLYSDANGYADLASLYGRFNASASDVSACSYRYDRASNYIYLYNDAGTAWLGPVVLGSQLTNSQCTLGAGGTTPSGNNLTLNLTITFTTSFAGAKNVYMQAVDAASASSGWQTRGTWTVPTGNQPPQAVSVTPSSGSGANQTFSLLFSDPNGYTDLNTVEALINTSASQASACDVRYLVGSNALYLRDNAGATWLGPVTLGSADTLHNDQCVIRASTSSASGAGNNLTLNLAVYFKAGFAGAKTVYMYAQDNGGLTSGSYWAAGTWTVPSSVAPASGSLYMNLGPLAVNKYEGPNSGEGQIAGCSTLSTFRACMQGALTDYYSQGIRGVRFQFGLRGAQSFAVDTAGNVNADWLQRLDKFFFDLRTAGITNIIPSPAMLDDWGFDQYHVQSVTDDCNIAKPTVQLRFYLHLPFGHEFSGNYDPWGNPTYQPQCTGINRGYADAAQNTYNFWGWPKIYDLIDKVLKATRDQYLTATELDMQNEIFIGTSTVTARLIYDYYRGEPILDRLRDKMALRMGEAYRYRVTFSVGAEKSYEPVTHPWSNCASVYGDAARIMALSQLLGAIGGSLIGEAWDRDATSGLSCGGVWWLDSNHDGIKQETENAYMYQMPYTYVPPSVLDVHEYPTRKGRDTPEDPVVKGECREGHPEECWKTDWATTNQDVQGHARLDFNGLKGMIDAYGPAGWHGYSPNIYGALVIIGESWPADGTATAPPFTQAPPSAASYILQGFGSSTLAGRPVIFAPWGYLWGGFIYPQRVVPPYSP